MKPLFYYVDCDGKVKNDTQINDDQHIEIKEYADYSLILIVNSVDGRVDDECVMWNSLEEMELAGIDISSYKEIKDDK